MFKFVFKSTLYYFLIKKYKSKITSIIFHVLLIIITTILYSDIVEYMTLNELKKEVLYLMLTKWLVYVISSYKIFSNIKSILIGDSDDDRAYEEQMNENEQYIDNLVSKKLDAMYEEIRDKPILKSKKSAIYDKYKNND